MCMVQLGMTNEIRPVNGQLQCNKCRQLLPVDRFHRSSSRKCGYACECKSCVATRHLDRKAADPEGCAEKSRAATAACRSRKKAAAPPAVVRPSTAVMPVDGKLPCHACKQSLPVESFHRNKARRCGYMGTCKECCANQTRAWRSANPDKNAAMMQAWRDSHREQIAEYDRRKHLKSVYGITPERYDEMLVAQDGRCAVCGTDDPGNKQFPRFPVDHDHATNAVRKLLCHSCNKMLGLVNDDVDRLLALAAYLMQYQDVLVITDRE